MAQEQTINKLHEMRLSTLARAYRDQSQDPAYAAMSFDERLSLLVDVEWDSRRINKRTRLLRSANFSAHEANIIGIRYDADRALDRSKIEDLTRCAWIRDGLNVIITGSTGAGKSWLACALGVCACNNFYSVRYTRLPQLLDSLALAKETKTYAKWQKRYIKCDLLIIDDWLLVGCSETEACEVLEIIEARNATHSTLLCSQYSPGGWHTKLGDGAIADAVIDRLVHSSHIIHIEGKESMRKRTSKL
jgi:DNA replication protein DnaC